MDICSFIEKGLPYTESIAVIVASIVAIISLINWRKQQKYSKKVEVAEKALLGFYEASDKIAMIRSPFSYEGEGNSRKKSEYETEEETRILNQAYVVIERYNTVSQVFNDLKTTENLFSIYFGKQNTKPFKIIDEVTRDLFTSSHMLSHLWQRLRKKNITENAIKQNSEEIEKYIKIFWYSGEDDEIIKKINDAIKDIENTCKSIFPIDSYKHKNKKE